MGEKTNLNKYFKNFPEITTFYVKHGQHHVATSQEYLNRKISEILAPSVSKWKKWSPLESYNLGIIFLQCNNAQRDNKFQLLHR